MIDVDFPAYVGLQKMGDIEFGTGDFLVMLIVFRLSSYWGFNNLEPSEIVIDGQHFLTTCHTVDG